MEKVYYVDGKFVPADEAVLPVTDLAILRGYGVFDYFRTYGRKPIQIQRNLARLRSSAALIGLTIPWADNELTTIILEAVERNGFDESSVRVIVTGGETQDFITPQAKPRLIVYVEPVRYLPSQYYTDGVKIITVDEERYLPLSKSLSYTSAIVAQQAARQAGAVEAVYVDRNGNAREATTSNLFAFYGGRVVTESAGILPGITRGRVLEILLRDYVIEERSLPYTELLQADEVVLTSANKEVVPVVQINDVFVGKGVVGEHAKRLMRAFQDYVKHAAHHRDQMMQI